MTATTNRLARLLPACIALATGLLCGCSDSRTTMSGKTTAPASAETSDRAAAAQMSKTPVRERVASAALDDRRLGQIRGGMDTISGTVVNFSFHEATYVNHNLAQSIVVPTLTIAPGANAASIAGVAAPAGSAGGLAPNAVVSLGNTATQAQVSAPAMIVQSLVNSGMTSVVSSLGGGGVSNTITNSANNQLVQQVITANVNITGLSQSIQQSVASTVMSRVVAANSQFR